MVVSCNFLVTKHVFPETKFLHGMPSAWHRVLLTLKCLIFAGMQIALGADFRFASRDCRLSIMEAKWGLIPDMSISITLRELLRMDVAKELTMTGRVLDGLQAAELGLVTRCVDDPMAEAEKIVKEIVARCVLLMSWDTCSLMLHKLNVVPNVLLRRSPDSIALTKELFQKTWVAPEDYCLQVETDLQRTLLASWNQLAASGRNFGWNIPYFRRK